MKHSITETISSLYTDGCDGASAFCLDRMKKDKQTAVFTPNSEIIYKASKSNELFETLRSAQLLFPDGIGSYVGMKLLSLPVKNRTTGIDLAEIILSECAKCGYSIFLLGGKEGVALKAAIKLKNKYQGLNICGYHHGYFDSDKKIINKINSSGADILFVCLGFPKQEKWIAKNLHSLPSVKLAMGLGGSLDVWSGNVRRAPHFISAAGFEWLWRTCKDPKRVKRIGFLVVFSILLLKETVFKPKKFGKCYEIDNFLK